ncbi:nitrate reductase [Prunus yedoensis var. nudiflora]|uniref:NADH-cytochrome b5 reductase n=1 Tax=Prunus yedoensis var. nudiflora TaxID=2094558 RepID=A0A314UH52_PRUYE|nr:nitrate reductase [Prunus yedoensis var. nudiflora]
MRAYTPSSSIDEVGYFDLVVKIYFKNVHPKFPNGGLMSQHLDSLPIGAAIDIKGPLGHIEYTGRGHFLVNGKPKFAKKLAMLAGGTGITPIYQVAQAILKDPEDKYERFKVWYVVENGREGWEYSVGFITIMREHLPDGSDGSLALACGPPPMIKFAVQPNLLKMNYDTTDSLLVF